MLQMNNYHYTFLGSDICTDLDFDKTTTLNRYQIRLNAVEIEPFIKINLSLPKQEIFRGDNSEIIKIFLNKLNASLEITILHRDIYSLSGIGPNGTFQGLMAPVSDNRIDIAMNTRPLLTSWKIKYVLIFFKKLKNNLYINSLRGFFKNLSLRTL